MIPMESVKKTRVMAKMYDDHFMSMPKLSPRIGFCNVSTMLNVQLIIKKPTIRNIIH